jgi:hypothetical protein
MDSCNLKSRDYCRGTTEWDDTFDASSEEAQIALMVSLKYANSSISHPNSLSLHDVMLYVRIYIFTYTVTLHK